MGAEAIGVAVQARTEYRAGKLRKLQSLRPQGLPPVMASPPSITQGVAGAGSAVAAGQTPPFCLYTWNGGSLTLASCDPVVAGVSSPLSKYARGNSVAGSTRTSNVKRLRFMADSPAFEVLLYCLGGSFVVLVDELDGKGLQFVSRAPTYIPADSGQRNFKVDFGSDTSSIEAIKPSVTAVGSGYAVGDTITLAGGTSTTAAVMTVTSVSSGGVTGLAVTTPGVYSAQPTGNISQASTSGAGTGMTVTMIWGRTHTKRKMRRIEVLLTGESHLAGINAGYQDTVLPWRVVGPRVLVVGDSISANFNATGPQGWDVQLGWRLGLDDVWPSGVSGQGFITQINGQAFIDRIALDVAAYAPDVIITAGGINDTGSADATVQAAVTAYYAALRSQNPNAYLIGLNSWRGKSTTVPSTTYAAAIKAGFSAVADSRMAFIDNLTEAWQTGGLGDAVNQTGSGNSDFWTSSDGTHPHQAGHDFLGAITAGRVFDTLQALAA